MNSRKHFGGGYMYPQDQEFQSSNSCLPGNGNETRALDMQMFKGLQPVVVDRFGNSLAETDRQLGYFSSQLTEGVPNDWNYNPIPQVGHIGYAQAIRNGSALDPFYQAKHAGYSQAIRSGSTCRNGCMENILSPDITAQSESPNITLGKSYGAPNGHLLPSLQSFVDNCGQSVPISSLLDMLSQPLDSTIFSNTNNFNKMQQPARMEMASFPAKVKQGNHTNESGRSTNAFHELNQHDYNLNHSPRNNNTCDADSIANLPVTLDKSIEVENFQLSTMTGSTIEQNHIKSTENEAIQHSYDGVLQNVESSTAASTLSRITIDLTKISDQGIDLNKTPQQKPAKRRKHRPKVVIEGKPERRTGTTTKNSATSNEKSSGKRKYVRRKVMTELDQKPGARKKTPDSNSGRARRSCKRNLDFDLDKSDGGNPENIVCQHGLQQTNRSFELNSISEDTGSCSRFNSVGQMEPKTKISLQNGFEEANEQEIAHTSLTPSTSCNEYKWNENTFLQNQQKVSSILDIDKSLHTGNLSFTNRHGEIGKNDPGQHRYTLTHHQPDLEGKGQTLFQENTQGGLIKSRNLLPYTAPKNVIQFPINPSKARGLGYYHTAEQPYPIATNTIWEAECHRHSCSTVSEDGQKKRKVENRILMKMPVPHSSLVQFENDTIHSRIDKACSPTSQTIQSVLKSYSGSNYPQTLNTGVNNYSDIDSLYPQLPAGSSFSRHHNSSPPESYLERVGEAKKLAQVNSSTPQIVDKCKLTPQTPAKTTRAVKRQTSKRKYVKRSAKSKKAATTPFTSNVLDANGALQEQESPSDHVHSFQKTRGDEAHTYPYIDEVIKLLNSLNIRAISDQNQKALIPYGGSGAIIPLDTKKKRPRPKVDLDTETIRVWNLLMGIEGGTGTDTMHKGSESWWESERKVFRGRTDSFIARMRLVQGDRHFSRWKGSVVDSVIGVFLTQNVSDHLSSSAFMTLAAAFPLNLRSSSRVSPQNSAGMLVEEPETSVPDPNEPARHDKVSYRITETSRTESQSLDEEIISPQDSFDSSVIQGTGTIRSYSGSNSEAEDTTPQNAYHRIHESTSTEALLPGKATPFEDNFNRVTGSSLSDQRSSHRRTKRDNIEYQQQTALLHIGNSDNMPEHSPVMHVENSKLNTADSGVQQGFNEESSSSWPATISILGHTKEVPSSSSMIGQTGSLKSSTVKNQDLPISEEKIPRVHNALTEQQCTSTPEYKTANFQQCDINSQLESITGTKQINIAKVLVDGETSTIQHIHNVSNIYKDTFEVEKSNLTTEKQRKLDYIEEATVSKDQHRPSATASNGSNNSINKRKKGKAGGEIKPDEYWESLRKQVQGEGNNKEKSHDAMDSMDYEAIRHASVNHISGVIKERGMNNRLAERMKEFLNRLVQAHGGIDLEWLRDVSPDEAKDYLLNIWGIGLKSVECVRLLTLHHLAFPVDTNVGRIAVRLGWVPLQPLPESLQLHLLELYPILDTIQKYLWPRLCQLDQQTLYELHYHLITFGKVFCTKHKPNCNACPMRGECRHFASAFASARLALPGPKEKNIVSSCPPIASEGDKPLEINKVPQLTALSSSLTVTCSGKSKCLPIIEEPKTPEPEPREVLEYDIEDAFWEDPDEIPFFRLNMQEFTDNLQNYVQANMELQESDVSKALVALTPEAASIPAPKLKNVNRLRTEHQVYELPDLHPLLEGMDRREPDDPSPYLFAIWTPGETANTVQPPESICDSQETGKLCNEKTCFTCNNIRESDSQTVRGTLLIPCRTAMRGRFPLNGTYFQVNEVFADDNSSKNPIAVPRQWLWNLPRRTVYFGTSVTSIFRGLTTEQIQLNFWRGFVCVRGFDQETRAPRPLVARLHCSLARLAKEKMEKAKDEKH